MRDIPAPDGAKEPPSASAINRHYAIAGYLAYIVCYALAAVECIYHGVEFHAPMFAGFICVYAIGAHAARRYKIYAEMRALRVGMSIAAICCAANVYLMWRIDHAVVARTIVILLLNILWFSHRQQALRWLRHEARLVQGSTMWMEGRGGSGDDDSDVAAGRWRGSGDNTSPGGAQENPCGRDSD